MYPVSVFFFLPMKWDESFALVGALGPTIQERSVLRLIVFVFAVETRAGFMVGGAAACLGEPLAARHVVNLAHPIVLTLTCTSGERLTIHCA